VHPADAAVGEHEPTRGRAPDEQRLVAELDDGAAVGTLHHLDANLAQVHRQRLGIRVQILGRDLVSL